MAALQAPVSVNTLVGLTVTALPSTANTDDDRTVYLQNMSANIVALTWVTRGGSFTGRSITSAPTQTQRVPAGASISMPFTGHWDVGIVADTAGSDVSLTYDDRHHAVSGS